MEHDDETWSLMSADGQGISSFDSIDELLANEVRPQAALVLSQGQVVGEGYEIVRLIGRGGMGSVYVARDLRLGRPVAIKLLHVRQGDERAELLFRDARATARLRHPHIVTIFHVSSFHTQPFMVLELLEGVSLRLHLERRGCLELPQALRVMRQLTEALIHAHDHGVIHRDLKPENVFLQDNGVLKVLDFGIALVDVDPSEPQRAAGSLGYMAPEQVLGQGQDARVDLWACGVLLAEMLSGELPDAGDLGAFPAPVAALIGDLLHDDPESRIATARELLARLEQISPRAPASHLADRVAMPYRYLEVFDDSDAPLFYGRDEAAAKLAATVRRRPLTIVVGPAGAGKSSLVRAGLLATLRRGGESWELWSLRPGARPLSRIAALIGSIADADVEPSRLARAPGIAGQLLRRAAQARGSSIVVLVDQLEELETLSHGQETADFWGVLLSIADLPDTPLRVVATLRDDFLRLLSAQPEIERAGHLSLLHRPDRRNLRKALQQPALDMGVRFEEGLVELILDDLVDEVSPLPLLQFTASKLWERRHKGWITLADYRAIGGVSGVFGELAEEIVSTLDSAADIEALRRMITALVTPKGTKRARRYEDLVTMAHDPDRGERLLSRFVAARLLTRSRGAVELAHEALIARWPSLQHWLDEDALVHRFAQRLEDAARFWEEESRQRDLLWLDATLGQALQFGARLRDRLSPRGLAFLQASEELDEQRRRQQSTLSLVMANLARRSQQSERQALDAFEGAEGLLDFVLDEIVALVDSEADSELLRQLDEALAVYEQATELLDDQRQGPDYTRRQVKRLAVRASLARTRSDLAAYASLSLQAIAEAETLLDEGGDADRFAYSELAIDFLHHAMTLGEFRSHPPLPEERARAILERVYRALETLDHGEAHLLYLDALSFDVVSLRRAPLSRLEAYLGTLASTGELEMPGWELRVSTILRRVAGLAQVGDTQAEAWLMQAAGMLKRGASQASSPRRFMMPLMWVAIFLASLPHRDTVVDGSHALDLAMSVYINEPRDREVYPYVEALILALWIAQRLMGNDAALEARAQVLEAQLRGLVSVLGDDDDEVLHWTLELVAWMSWDARRLRGELEGSDWDRLEAVLEAGMAYHRIATMQAHYHLEVLLVGIEGAHGAGRSELARRTLALAWSHWERDMARLPPGWGPSYYEPLLRRWEVRLEGGHLGEVVEAAARYREDRGFLGRYDIYNDRLRLVMAAVHRELDHEEAAAREIEAIEYSPLKAVTFSG